MARKRAIEIPMGELRSARRQFARNFSRARTSLGKAQKDIGRYIEKNPKKAVAIAAGIGAAIGMVASRMRRKR